MLTPSPLLLPAPRNCAFTGARSALPAGRLIALAGAGAQALRLAARRFQAALRQASQGALSWEIVAGDAAPAELVGLELRVDPWRVPQAQGYRLRLGAERLAVVAHDEAGAFYAVCTLLQLLAQYGAALPCGTIADWPDVPVRGVLLDVSRDKVPTLETLRALVDLLAGLKINQLQLYTEHTFAYRRHPEVWANASPLTGEDLLELDAYCRERHVDLVPNQNSFGHMHRWLEHARYRPLAEVPGGFAVAHGWGHAPFSLCPTDPASLDFVRSLYDELLPHFSSRLFNVGCDETFDLGQGRSQEACALRGTGRVYLEFLQALEREVRARGRTMLYWADIVAVHPELIGELPRTAVALEWGYEADHPFEARAARLAAAGVPFYVCPGTSAWCSIGGRTDVALANLRSAAESGLRHGACGYLITDWGDHGHWQAQPVSYLGFAAGAAYAWALEANRALDLPAALSLHAFGDASGAMGRVAFDLGLVHRELGVQRQNGTLLFAILQWPLERARTKLQRVEPEAFARTVAAIDRAVAPLATARCTRPDAGLLLRELTLTARLERLACRRGLLALAPDPALARALDAEVEEFIRDYRGVWLARNRPGGLADSVARLEQLRVAQGAAELLPQA